MYRDDPNWIPPLRGDQKEMVGYKPHPFYARNSIQTFLAYRGGEVCGRIAAILNQGHIAQYNERRGFFGFFECVDDQEAANGLFDAVRHWFADQDIHRLRGPTNPSLNYELGLLIDGFDSPPTFMMTYNPPYYARLIENYGFRKTQDLYAFWGHIDMLPKIAAETRAGRRADHRALQRQAAPAGQVAVPGRRGDVPVDLQPLAGEHVGIRADVGRTRCATWPTGLRHIIVPEMAVAAEIDGRVVGAVVRPARLQPAHQGDRRPAVSLRLPAPAAEPAGDQTHPPDQHQRAARVSAAWAWAWC